MDQEQKERKQDADIQALQAKVRKLERLLQARVQTFPFVAGTPTINGHIPTIIDGKTHKIATVA